MWIPSQFPHHTLHTSFISHPSASPTPTPSTNPKPTHQKPFQSIMSYGLCPRLSPPSPNLPFQLSSAHSPDCQEMMALGGKHRSASLRIAPLRTALRVFNDGTTLYLRCEHSAGRRGGNYRWDFRQAGRGERPRSR